MRWSWLRRGLPALSWIASRLWSSRCDVEYQRRLDAWNACHDPTEYVRRTIECDEVFEAGEPGIFFVCSYELIKI